MANPSSFSHLNLIFKKSGEAKLRGGGKATDLTKNNKKNRDSHSALLNTQASQYHNAWFAKRNERKNNNLPSLPDAIPLQLKVDPNIDIDYLGSTFNFDIISEEDDGFVIVTTGDTDLSELNEKLNEFKGKVHGSATVANIHEIEIDENSRLKRILTEDLERVWPSIDDNHEYILDVGIECRGYASFPSIKERGERESTVKWEKRLARYNEKKTKVYESYDETRLERENSFSSFVEGYQGSILTMIDNAVEAVSQLSDSFTARIKIRGKGLKDIVLNFPYIFEASLPDEFEENDFTPIDLDENNNLQIKKPDENAPVIGVIDSGIQEQHPFLAGAIKESISKSYIDENNLADEVSPNGHGTRVAGCILFPETVLDTANLKQEFFLANIKLLDKYNSIPEEIQPAKAIEMIISKYYGEHGIKIFNHSINSCSPSRKKHMSPWASAIDKLSYENDILIIQSAGNILCRSGNNARPSVKDFINADKQYPDYLYEPSSRISNPAQSLSALTVGAISHTDKLQGDWNSFGDKNDPSAFSRTGLGIWDTIKPDVVEYGGDYVYDNIQNPNISTQKETSLNLLRTTNTPGKLLAQDGVGTSFAAPKVTNIAASLQLLYPDEPPLLYKALIAQGARWPKGFLRDSLPDEEKIRLLRSYGYGLVNKDHSLYNSDHRVTLISSGKKSIKAGEAQVFSVPLPKEVREVGDEFDILVEVTLSFAARPRRTRQKFRNYFSTWVDWDTSKKGEKAESFASRILKGEEGVVSHDGHIPWSLGLRSVEGKIPQARRNLSCLQKDWALLKSNELMEEFFLGIRGHEGWDNDKDATADYCVVVSFEAINKDVELYSPVKNHIDSLTVDVENLEVGVSEDDLDLL